MEAKVVNTSLLGYPSAARRGGRRERGGRGGGREREGGLTFHSKHSVEWVSVGKACAQPLRGNTERDSQ